MSEQLVLPGFPPHREADNRLFFATFPPPHVAQRVSRLAFQLRRESLLAGPPLPAARLHVSLHMLGDYEETVPVSLIEAARDAAGTVAMPPFEIRFDRVMSFYNRKRSRAFVMRLTENSAGLAELHRLLGRGMKTAGLSRWAGSHFTPHMTLLYDQRLIDVRHVDEIRWLVSDFTLVHSLSARAGTFISHAGRCAVRMGRQFSRGLALAITIYGIKNCDTMKKARAWLDKHGVDYNFHDYKSVGIDKDRLAHWSKTVGWEMLLNRAGTTFRKLPDADKANINEKKALALMLAQPSMIKRPVLDIGGKLLVGFKPEVYEKAVKR